MKKCEKKEKKVGREEPKKYTCKRCGLTSNKEARLCKPEKN